MCEVKTGALIAMSGGVDSSVAAALCCKQGYQCIGVTMKLYDNEEDTDQSSGHIQAESASCAQGCGVSKTCCSLEDVEDARGVARKLQMPYYVFNFKDDFKQKVIDRFVNSYLHGRTPNPCIDCNRYLKFGHLFRRAKELGCEYIVTGHYARIGYDPATGRYTLSKAVDLSKDQSYVLYSMTQEELARTLLPLGEYTKEQTRRMAEEAGLLNAKKHDSQDICFVPDGDYAGFIRRYLKRREAEASFDGQQEKEAEASFDGQQEKEAEASFDGQQEKEAEVSFVDTVGNLLGRAEKGIYGYTIGQRKGLGLSLKSPLYVCEIRPERGEVVLGAEQELYHRQLRAEEFNWLSIAPPSGPVACRAKIRYRQQEQEAVAERLPDGSVLVTFEQPQRAMTKGQAVVLYQGDLVLGGGTIAEAAAQ